MPAQMKPLPEVDEAACAGAGRRDRARVEGERRSPYRAHARRLRQRDSGVALHRWRALSGLCRAGARDRGFAPARRGTGDGRRRRYRPLDRRRHVQRQRRRAARERAGQPIRARASKRTWSSPQPPHLPAGTDLDAKGVDGVGVVGLPKDRMLALRRQAQAASAAAPVDTGLSLERSASATQCQAATRRGSRCAPSMTARSGLYPVPGGHRSRRTAAAVRHRRAGRRATGELPFPLAVLHRGSAVRRGRTAPGWRWRRRGADRAHRWRGAEELTMSQDDTPTLPPAGEGGAEAVALRAQPRPVTRLNRRTLAILAGGLSVAVLGALMWSLQPQRRGANSRPSFTTWIACRSRKDWTGCRRTTQAAACRARAGAATAGRSWPGHREIEAAGDGRLRGPAGHRTTRCAKRPKRPRPRRCSSARVRAKGRAGGAVAGRRRSGPRRQCGVRPAGGCRPRRRPSLPTRPPYRTGKTRKGLS